MNEEKPVFKITDRRLFNPDGSPREDIVREEEPAAAAPATTTAPSDASAQPVAEAPSAASPAANNAAASPAAATPPPATRAEPAPEETEPSQEFLMLVEFVAGFAADAMGMVGRPGEIGGGHNLPLARQCIDMLAALREKSQGNLAAEERQFLEAVISQLRMQYVTLTSAPQGKAGGAPRGFTGGDITGGR